MLYFNMMQICAVTFGEFIPQLLGDLFRNFGAAWFRSIGLFYEMPSA